MRLRLTHFAGLRVNLSPDWYEVPSHLPESEVRRLLDILIDAVPGVEDVVECNWADLRVDTVAKQLGPTTLAFVTIPTGIDEATRNAVLQPIRVRLGLFEYDQPGRWPESPWSETEVKASLAAWLRQMLRRPTHPFAGLGIATLPFELLTKATSEPVELLELIEATLEYGARQQTERPNLAVDWKQCARWSIGRRLANRLGGTQAPARLEDLARVIAAAPGGTLRRLSSPREVDELVRLGLAKTAEGDVLLAPLARLAAEQDVIEILEIEGARGVPMTPAMFGQSKPARSRASSPSAAVLAFDPQIPVAPDDPWFVDLGPLVPEIAEFGRRLIQQLERRDRHVQLAIVQQPGSGTSTMIRKWLSDLAISGLVTLRVPTPTHAGFGFVDLLLAMLLAGLEHSSRPDSNFSGPPEPVLARLRNWLAEHALQGDLRDYLLLGGGVNEHVRVPSLLVLLRRLIDLASTAGPDRVRMRPVLDARTDEILAYLVELLDHLSAQMAARGMHTCLHVEGSELLGQAVVDEVFTRHAKDLARLPCHVVFGVGLLAEHLPEQRTPSELITTLVMPPLALPDHPALVHALLAARSDLAQVFESPESATKSIANAAGSQLRHVFEIAKLACSTASPSPRVTQKTLAAAERTFHESLTAGLRFSDIAVAVEIATTNQLVRSAASERLLDQGLLVVGPDARWDVHPALRDEVARRRQAERPEPPAPMPPVAVPATQPPKPALVWVGVGLGVIAAFALGIVVASSMMPDPDPKPDPPVATTAPADPSTGTESETGTQSETGTEVEPVPEPAKPLGNLEDPPIGEARGVVHTALAGAGEPTMEFIGLTNGEFTMGSPESEPGHRSDERQHRVRISAFAIGKTEVSLAQYELVMNERSKDCTYGCKDAHPVQNVSWTDAVRFMNKLTRRENQRLGETLTECYDEKTWTWDRACTGYRLPTEAEWEYASRAGTTTPWSFGSQEKDICKYANVDPTKCEDGYAKLAPVETPTLQPNAWGLHAMYGNVWEWVFDGYDSEFYSSSPTANPVTEKTTEIRALRGGAFNDGPEFTRSADRDGGQPEYRYWNFGFRCARGAVPQL